MLRSRSTQLLVFDGDDTLWETMSLYTDAKSRFAEAMTQVGLPAARGLVLLEEIDLENVKHLGFARSRFPTSLTQAYERLCTDTLMTVDPYVRANVAALGHSVFEQPPRVIAGALHQLALLRDRYRMVLCTKGEEEIQSRRIADAGVAQFFEKTCIVPTKGAAEFRAILSDLNHDAALSCSIGNSVRSDINPALSVGMRAVWIPNETWGYEDAELGVGDVVKIAAISQLSDALRHIDDRTQAVPRI